MVCHGELASLKPQPRYFTSFYVMMSLGGPGGGLFVGLIAPNFCHANYELPDGLAICAALVVILVPRPRATWLHAVWLRSAWWRAALAAMLCGDVIFLGVGVREDVHGYRVVERNFYGLLRVADNGNPSQ